MYYSESNDGEDWREHLFENLIFLPIFIFLSLLRTKEESVDVCKL